MRLTNLADELRREHPWLRVVEIAEVDNNVHQGDTWKRRGHDYARAPVNVTWHHTASGGSQIGILRFELYKYSVPGNNSNVGRDGTVYLLAAGSAATNGSVTQRQFSRGVGGTNGTSFTIEIHNDGVGQSYPSVQLDAVFALNQTVNRLCGNQVTDLATHHELAPGRKMDPARASVVQGLWQPRSVNSSGTWHGDDIRAEALARFNGAGSTPIPIPIPEEEDDMPKMLVGSGSDGSRWSITPDLGAKFPIWQEDAAGLIAAETHVESNLRTDTVDRIAALGKPLIVDVIGDDKGQA